MFVAMSLIPAGDSAGKLLTGSLGVSPLFVAWSRFALGLLLILPFLPGGSLALLKDGRIWLRALALCGGITSIQFALRSVDVATVFAAFFVGPIFSTLLAVVFLRERLPLLRAVLLGLGFAGVLLVVRPGFDMQAGVLWAVLAGLFYGSYLTMSRWLAGVAAPLALTFSQLAISALVLLPLGLSHLPPASVEIGLLTLASAGFSMLGNLLLLFAYRLASATVLAPMVYFQLIAAVLLGWMIFGNLPDLLTLVGMAVIVLAGVGSARLR